MATQTSAFFELLEADAKDIFFKTFAMIPELWPQLFKSEPSNRAYVDGMRVAGFGTLVTKPEGTPIAFDDPIQGTRVRTVHTTYGLGTRTTMEMIDDDQFGVMKDLIADLGDSTRDHRERLAWGLLDDGFTGTTYTGLEGDTLFSDTHSLLKATGTASNELVPAVALGITGIESIMTLARTTVSEEGRFQNIPMSILCIPPDLEHQAYVLLNTVFQTGSGNNDLNTVASSRNGLTPLIVPYKTSTSAWTVHAPPGQNSLTWNNRKDVEFTTAADPNTKDMKNYALYRASVMFREWRGNFGSNF